MDAGAGQRSGGPTASAAERGGGRRAAGDRFLFHRSDAAAFPDDPAARVARHRHSSGRIALRHSRFVRAARRRAVARGPAARALPREGNSRGRDTAGRHVAPGHAHPGLGFPLAARVSRRDADPASERHAVVDGVHLRQLRVERPQSGAAAGARVLGPALSRRDGRSVVSAARIERQRPRADGQPRSTPR